ARGDLRRAPRGDHTSPPLGGLLLRALRRARRATPRGDHRAPVLRLAERARRERGAVPRLRGAPGGEDGIEAAGALPRAAHFGVGQTRAVRAPSPGAAQLRRRSAPAPRGEALTGATRGGARPSKGAGGGAKASGGPFGGSRPGGIGRGGSAPGRRRRRAPRVSREVRVGEGGRGRLGDGG